MTRAPLLNFACKSASTAASHGMVNAGGGDGRDGRGGGDVVAAEALRVHEGDAPPPADVGADDNDVGASLARRFAAAEPAAFEEVVSAYQRRVERLAHRLLGWRAGEVEDAVQDVFLAALTHAGRLRGGRGASGLWAWLATITVNTCRSRMRRAWVLQKVLGRSRPRAEPESPAADVGAELGEELRAVRGAIERLVARDREVIVLHCLEGMRLDDVAGVLGVSNNAVQVRLHRARQRLRRELGDQTAKD
jgi:RNA polymerase sigma-70 factor (ECF subfamily)